MIRRNNRTTTVDAAEGLSRRGFLAAGGAAAGAALALAACGKDNGASTDTTAGPTTTGVASAGGDGKVAATAAGLEVLAVGTYRAALDAAQAGKLGAVPPAVVTYVQTAMSQHQTALDTWNSVLTSAGQPKVTAPPADLKAEIDKQFAGVKNVADAARLALRLERIASHTYLAAIPGLQGKDAITTAGGIQVVDQEHVAILLFVLGEYPVPDVFQKTDQAYKG